MSVTTAKIRAREAATGKKAYTAIDNAGNLHYAFDNATLQSIVQKANVAFSDQQSAKAYNQALEQSSANNQFNADQAQKQMDFQERMSSTAHQREVKDLIAAGLNPVLSANGGASTPAGASASADTSTASLKAQMYMQQLNAGVQLALNRQNIESAQKMAKWQNDLNREIAYAQLSNNSAIANIQAAASMYGADQASSASRYATDNPNNPGMWILKGLFGSSKRAGTTAKGYFKSFWDMFTDPDNYGKLGEWWKKNHK